MLALVAIVTALLPIFSGLAAAAAADGIDFFQIQQVNSLDFTNFATHQIGAGLGFPECDGYESFGYVTEESLPYYQHSCGNSGPPPFFTFSAKCDAGPKQANIYQRGGDRGDVYEAYCNEGDGNVIGNCYYRYEATPCPSQFGGGINVKLLDCYFDTCATC
jgi:hypothetical protein